MGACDLVGQLLVKLELTAGHDNDLGNWLSVDFIDVDTHAHGAILALVVDSALLDIRVGNWVSLRGIEFKVCRRGVEICRGGIKLCQHGLQVLCRDLRGDGRKEERERCRDQIFLPKGIDFLFLLNG